MIGILVPERGGGEVEVIEGGEVVLEPRVGVKVQQEPVQLSLLAPLGELTDLTAHEPELGTGVGHHPRRKSPRTRELLPVVAGHLVQKRLFQMHHLVVGDGQDVPLVKSI